MAISQEDDIELVKVVAYGISGEFRFTFQIPKMKDGKSQLIFALNEARRLNEGEEYRHLINNPIWYVSFSDNQYYFKVDSIKLRPHTFCEVIALNRRELIIQ